MIFLTVILSSCATIKDEKLNVQWEFIEFPSGQKMACTDQKGVEQIRERLIRCGELGTD